LFFFLVALNYQTKDNEAFLNQAMFSYNGGCGYVLKPDFMRDEKLAYSPVSPCSLDPVLYPAWRMEIKVISGQNLFLADGNDCDDPYVKVKIRGHPDDDESDRYFFKSFKVRLANFNSLKAHCFWLGITCYFLATRGSKIAWNCWCLNPGPSHSQPDAMTTRPLYLYILWSNTINFTKSNFIFKQRVSRKLEESKKQRKNSNCSE